MLTNFIALGQLYNISKFTTKEGLAQNHCRAIAKDSRGNIWIGTYEGGLCRYDGQKIRTYTVQNGLSNNFIYDIVEDDDHNIWVATANGLSKFDGNTFTNYLDNDTLHIKVTSLAKDLDGKIWFYQQTKGIASISTEGVTKYINNSQVDTLKVQSLFKNLNT
jgi:ligand-binding sensor domain-containing protein